MLKFKIELDRNQYVVEVVEADDEETAILEFWTSVWDAYTGEIENTITATKIEEEEPNAN